MGKQDTTHHAASTHAAGGVEENRENSRTLFDLKTLTWKTHVCCLEYG